MGAQKSVQVQVSVTTEVLSLNPDCRFSGAHEDDALVITVDTRKQNVHQRLGLHTRTKLHWTGKNEFLVQELSGLPWPIRYRVLTREGYYLDPDGARVHFTTEAAGLDARRGVSLVLMRAAMLLIVVAGVGVRTASFLLEMLFHVEVSKSALHRWIGEIADSLPQGDDMILALHAKQPITEAHFDEIFPNGQRACVLVLRDEHGRILTTEEVERRDEETVAAFLKRIKALKLPLKAFFIDGCQAYYNAIRQVFGDTVAIQYDYFHVIQNIWKKLWKWMLGRRREIKRRAEASWTPWYAAQLEALAKALWKNRYLLFKADERLSEQERDRLAELVELDPHVGRLRAFLAGVRSLFNDSSTPEEARLALARLKLMPTERRDPEPFEQSIGFLEKHFDWMTAYLREEGVRRNSLAETGMRVLRRLESGHDGFRSRAGRENALRIYQAVKYLGWTVHQLPRPEARSP